MPPARIRSLEFVPAGASLAPESSSSGLKAGLEDGGESTFTVATGDQPARWIDPAGYCFGAPVLFVRRLDEPTVAEAAEGMAAEMGGYWLRYYNSPGEPSPVGGAKKGKRAPAAGMKVVSLAITEAYPPRSPDHGCAVIQVRIADGREFSMLSATPSWFAKAFEEIGLAYYFGPSVLFLKRIEPKLVRKAVTAMAADGDLWLCRYDTPRRTLPEVLADFKTRYTRRNALKTPGA
jgi:hypothetical protein